MIGAPIALLALLAVTDTFPTRPASDDVTSIDGVIAAFYDIVSGPAGEAPDRARDELLHRPGARIGMSGIRADGTPYLLSTDLDGYYQRFGGVRAEPFYEWEINRVVQRFGNIAQVWSTYVTSDAPRGTPNGRGINSMHLWYDGQRWWVLGWIDEREHPGNPIPPEFLPPS